MKSCAARHGEKRRLSEVSFRFMARVDRNRAFSMRSGPDRHGEKRRLGEAIFPAVG